MKYQSIDFNTFANRIRRYTDKTYLRGFQISGVRPGRFPWGKPRFLITKYICKGEMLPNTMMLKIMNSNRMHLTFTFQH